MDTLKSAVIGGLLSVTAVVWLISRLDRQGESGCFYRALEVVLLAPVVLMLVAG